MKNFLPLAISLALVFLGYQALGSAIYTYELVKFYGISDWSFSKHGLYTNGDASNTIVFNSNDPLGHMISITDLETVTPDSGKGSPQEWCPDITSKRGHVTMGFVRDMSVCCWTAGDSQLLVPVKQDKDTRSYLCGKWPFIDQVSQPITKTKIPIEFERNIHRILLLNSSNESLV